MIHFSVYALIVTCSFAAAHPQYTLPHHYRVNPLLNYLNPYYSAEPYIHRRPSFKPLTEGKDASIREHSPTMGESPVPEEKDVPLWKSSADVLLPRIIGGALVPSGEFPAYVVFVSYGAAACGGSLITSRHVLTSGFCFVYLPKSDPNIRALINTVSISPLDSKTEVRAVKDVYLHPDIGPSASGNFILNDIAVVRLDHPVRAVARVRLGDGLPGILVDIYGFGYYDLVSNYRRLVGGRQSVGPNNVNYIQSTQLRKTRGTLQFNEVCAAEYSETALLDSSKYFCTLPQVEQTCFGDGGSPVTVGGIQYGVVSTYNIRACLSNVSAIHLRVSGYRQWIDSVIDL